MDSEIFSSRGLLRASLNCVRRNGGEGGYRYIMLTPDAMLKRVKCVWEVRGGMLSVIAQ